MSEMGNVVLQVLVGGTKGIYIRGNRLLLLYLVRNGDLGYVWMVGIFAKGHIIYDCLTDQLVARLAD